MTTNAEDTDLFSREAIRRALRAWDSAKMLGAHPLADICIVQTRRQAAGYTDTPAGRGLALRETLIDAIQYIRPEGTPDPAEKRWRPYIILNEQYIQGRLPDLVAAELMVSRRTYYNEQEQAMEGIGDALRQWEAQALSQGSGAQPEPQEVATSPGELAARAPFLAPPRPSHELLGRAVLLEELKRRLLAADAAPALALHGLPGVGKTALAIELAHDPEVLAHFPDGILWAGVGRQPDVLAHLGAWAAALGLPAHEAPRPAPLARRAQEIHAAIGLKRMLLVVDDAWELNDALPFRVGGPHCVHLLTTRLASVALDFACDGALPVGELSTPDGLALLARMAPQAVQAEPEEAERLSLAAGGLPLALILMGRHLRRQSYGAQARRLRAAIAQLNEAATRLSLAQPQTLLEQRPDLPAETPISLRAIIGISDTALDAEARQALRALALFPPKPNSFPEAAALEVAAVPPAALDALVDFGLVEAIPPDRYTLHQTIADYARLDDPGPAARQRFLAYWVEFACQHAGDNRLLSQELDSLMWAMELAHNEQDHAALVKGITALQVFLFRRGLLAVAERHLSRGRHSAILLDDLPCLAAILRYLGIVTGRRGQYAEAEECLLESLALARRLENRQLEADSLRNLGDVNLYRGDFTTASAYYEQAIALYRQTGDRSGEGLGLRTLGAAFAEQGDFTRARQYYEQALILFRQVGDAQGESSTLNSLGGMFADTGEYARARAYYEYALPIKRQLGDRWGEAVLFNNLGVAALGQCNFEEGRVCFEHSLKIRYELGDRRGIGLMMGNLGVTLCRMGDYSAGRASLEHALQIHREIGVRHLEARDLGLLGLVLHHQGEDETACQYCRQAAEIAAEVGSRMYQGNALTYLGHALAALGHAGEARQAYRQALDLRRDAQQAHLAIDAQAGLARLALAQGDLEGAGQVVEEVLAYLAGRSLSGADEPIQAFLTCYQVLQARRDPRAAALLETGCGQLHEQAEKISEGEQRQAFLQNIAAHRELLAVAGPLASTLFGS